jgi:polyisoprenoid-binding protein YceI
MTQKIATLLTCFLLIAGAVNAQIKYFTKSGKITFYSKAPMEDIEATTKTAAAVLDAASGAVQFSVLMKGFEFRKALMQEHFNENYVESNKYPNGEFKGVIVNNADINYSKPGTYTARVRGKLTMHGVTKDVETNGTVVVEGDGLKTNTVFNIQLSDYNIKRPALVKDKLSNTIQISVDCKLEALKG